MANLLVDDSGRPLPQHTNQSTGNMELLKGINNAMNTNVINEILVKPSPEANQSDSLKVKVNAALPTGTNKIGSFDLASALPTGSNLIGNVGVQGSLPPGSNTIGKVVIDTIGALADTAVTNPALSASVIALLKGLLTVNNAALPTGTNTIGKVNINLSQFTPTKVTLIAATALQIKATPGYVAKIESILTDIILRDDDTEVWGGIGKVDFSNPVYLSTNITLISATGGDVYISYM